MHRVQAYVSLYSVHVNSLHSFDIMHLVQYFENYVPSSFPIPFLVPFPVPFLVPFLVPFPAERNPYLRNQG